MFLGVTEEFSESAELFKVFEEALLFAVFIRSDFICSILRKHFYFHYSEEALLFELKWLSIGD